MKIFSGFKTHFSSIHLNANHIGVCYLPGTNEYLTGLDHRSSDLFASLDDDDELMFGYGIEDY